MKDPFDFLDEPPGTPEIYQSEPGTLICLRCRCGLEWKGFSAVGGRGYSPAQNEAISLYWTHQGKCTDPRAVNQREGRRRHR